MRFIQVMIILGVLMFPVSDLISHAKPSVSKEPSAYVSPLDLHPHPISDLDQTPLDLHRDDAVPSEASGSSLL